MGMKRLFTYIVIISVLISCHKDPVSPLQPEGPWGGYITFSTEVATKSPINTNMRGKSFGVLGYSYDSNWATARPVSTPDLFYDQLVSCNSNGICEYDSDPAGGIQLKEWDLAKTYSFFAYYPTSEHTQIDISGATKADMPTVTYNYPFADVITVPGNTNLVDLMTAGTTDQTGRGSGKVGFNFNHRLFCFEILANNYNDDREITIKNLKLELTNLENASITVPLMASDTRTPITKTKRTTKTDDGKYSPVTYIISDTGTTAEIPKFSEGGTSFSLSEKCTMNNDGYIMLIPQSEPIIGNFTWDNMPDGDGVVTEFSSSLDFQEGKKYSIIINFAGDAITIAIIEAGNWSSNNVFTEFE